MGDPYIYNSSENSYHIVDNIEYQLHGKQTSDNSCHGVGAIAKCGHSTSNGELLLNENPSKENICSRCLNMVPFHISVKL